MQRLKIILPRALPFPTLICCLTALILLLRCIEDSIRLLFPLASFVPYPPPSLPLRSSCPGLKKKGAMRAWPFCRHKAKESDSSRMSRRIKSSGNEEVKQRRRDERLGGHVFLPPAHPALGRAGQHAGQTELLCVREGQRGDGTLPPDLTAANKALLTSRPGICQTTAILTTALLGLWTNWWLSLGGCTFLIIFTISSKKNQHFLIISTIY